MTRRVSELMSLVTALTLTVLAAVHVAPSQAAPQLLYYNQLVPQVPQVPQVPHLQRHSANVVVVPANAAGIQQFAASGVPLPVGGQYVLVHPGANPVLYVTRAEGEKPENPGTGEGGSGGGSEGGYIDSFVNFVFGFVPANPFPSLTGGSSTPKPTEEEKPTTSDKPTKDEKPIKVVDGQASSDAKPASLERFDEDEPPKAPVLPVVPAPGQRFVVVGQPQFFGNYDALRNQAVQQNLGTGGAVSSFLLLKNQDVVPLAAAANGKVEAHPVNHVPGESALEFQRYISAVKQQQAQQDASLFYIARQQPQPPVVHQSQDDSAGVVVEAFRSKPNSVRDDSDSETTGDNEDAENVEANPPGPSVAQVKPQAIALAGPGGVAAAAPIGTALVGPGGLAVAAPSATAVAGPSGGAPPPPGAQASSALSSPAAYKAYLLEQQAKGAYPAGSFQVAYNV